MNIEKALSIDNNLQSIASDNGDDIFSKESEEQKMTTKLDNFLQSLPKIDESSMLLPYKLEDHEKGNINYKHYQIYSKLMGGNWFIFLICLSIFITDFSVLSTDYWLTIWTNPKNNFTNNSWISLFYLSVFIMLDFFQLISLIGRSAFYDIKCLNGYKSLHNQLINSIIHAIISFFEVTPLGEVFSRFNNDMRIMETNFMYTVTSSLQGIFKLVLIISIVTIKCHLYLLL